MQRLKSWIFAASITFLTFAVHVLITAVRRSFHVVRDRRMPNQDMIPVSNLNTQFGPVTTSDRCADTSLAPLVRESERLRLRRHVPANRDAFQRWYADPEIAYLLRHDLRPLNERQSRGYFDSIILPLSATGHCFAIHDAVTDQLIGTTALTETDDGDPHAMLFRIVIGEKAFWDQGLGTEATKLVVQEAFDVLDLDEVRLEVFAHNPRAISVYERVGFVHTGEHTEWVGPNRPRLHVFEMTLRRPVDEDSPIPPDAE